MKALCPLRTFRSWLPIAAVAAALGVVAVVVTVSETDDALRGELLERTRLVAGSLDPDVLSQLSGGPMDAGRPEYLLLKAQLQRVRSSLEGCRFVYVMGIRPAIPGEPGGPAGEEVFFFADSESPESGESSPPGQAFPEASDELRDSFRTGREFVEGPSRDRWGTWVSALVPLTGGGGAVIAVVGADVDAGDWERTVLAAAAESVAATLAAIALLTLSILLARSRRRILAQQAALRESEERFREIVEQSSDVFYRQDIATGRFEYVSPRIRTLLGREPEELLAMSPEQQSAEIHADDLPALRGFVRDVVGADEEGRRTLEREFRIRHKAGEYRWIHGSCILLRGADGSPRAVLGSLHDVTERRRLEEEHLRLSVQLQQARRTEAVGRLAGGIAHDFNNLIMAINGYAELDLASLPADHPVRGDLEQIMTAGRRASSLTRQLLAFARQEEATPVPLDVEASIESMLPMLRRLLGTNITLEWVPCGDVGPVRMDPGQLDQILANLCLNARDAIRGVGRITVSTGRSGIAPGDGRSIADGAAAEYVVLSVEDDGSGMDAATMEHIFDPFFTTKEPGKGTGLGLATVYGIVTQNGGFVDVSSEPGRGSVFRIRLPVLRS